MNGAEQWLSMPSDLRLSHGAVDLWLISLDQTPSEIDRYSNFLDENERRAASRFRMADKTKESIITRGVLREHLAYVLNAKPEELEFRYETQGKPYLVGAHQDAGVCFNVSHSGSYALIAATMNRQIGVDIEQIRETVECASLARRFFSKRETADLLSLPIEKQRAAFFRCWTRKEAFVKALGKGIMMGLDQFDVSLLPEEPAKLLDVRLPNINAEDWSVLNIPLDVPVGENYLAAITLEGKNITLRKWKPQSFA